MAVFSGNGSNGSPSFTFSSDTDTGIYRITTNSLGIATAATDALAIDASQRVIIGATSNRTVGGSTAARLQLEGADNNASAFSITSTTNGVSSNGPNIVTSRIRGTGSVAALDTLGLWQFYGYDGSSYLDGGSIRAQLTSVSPSTGNFESQLLFRTRTGGTVGTWMTLSHDGYLRLNGAGKGIQFNGDTAAANALDDYEEGTWTPTGYGNFTVDPSASGRYIKIGKMVWLSLSLGACTTSTSGSTISGIPFNAGTPYDMCGVAVDQASFNPAAPAPGAKLGVTIRNATIYFERTTVVFRDRSALTIVYRVA